MALDETLASGQSGHLSDHQNLHRRYNEACVSVTDYGAVGDGVTDDTAAIKAAIEAAAGPIVQAAGASSRGGSVFFPPGVYQVSPSVLSNVAPTVTPSDCLMAGVKFVGAGHDATHLRLVTTAADQWFFDATSISPYWMAEFHDITFDAVNSTDGNGFRFKNETRHFAFYNCHFDNMAICLSGIGTTNADLMRFYNCQFYNHATALLWLENANSVGWMFDNCDSYYLTGDMVHVAAGSGGGQVIFRGCETTAEVGGATIGAMFCFGAGITDGGGNSIFAYDDGRAELRAATASIVKMTAAAGGGVSVGFRNSVLQTNAGASRVGVTVIALSRVAFDRCWLDERFTYVVDGTGSYWILGSAGILSFRDCSISDEALADRITFTEASGYATARGCHVAAETTTARRRYAQDFDLNWKGLGSATGGPALKMVPIIHADPVFGGWPDHDAAYESVVYLPPNAIIRNIHLFKPAGTGTDAVDYTLHVGTNDKGTTYGSSTTAHQDHEHKINLVDQMIDVGTAANTRAVRIWATTTATDPMLGVGWGFVEYY